MGVENTEKRRDLCSLIFDWYRDVVYRRGRLLSDEDGGGIEGFVFRREESYHVVEK
ncbi:hypothetical protein MTR_5g042240 [Medicago truncatula]|uniref:Uncharacterized protein n=1 Tax=Medicago truncatula TaxID=3880 RepID=G7JWH4_MEDTR|nr:hypothetical protein MTR_5g042240 [Medicago truncatula]